MKTHVLISTIFTGLLVFGTLTSPQANEDKPFISDDKEYAVMAAVLFQNSGKHQPEKDASLSRRSGLDGIPKNSFNLSRLTTTGSLTVKELDSSMVEDYNRNNTAEYRIDPAKLALVTPRGSAANLITPKRFSMDNAPERTKSIRSGTTYISRPGFNKTGTTAVLQISHVADPEMGIGYRVILEKSPRDGSWIITDAVVNRRY